MKCASLVVALASLVACGGERTPTSATPPAATALSAAVRSYLDELLGILQTNSLHRLTLDWNAIRANVINAAGSAQTTADALPAIRVAIAALGDGHSSYRTPSGTVIFVATRTCSGSGGPSNAGVPAGIGYVSVASFGGTPAEATAFADAIQDRIRAADREGLTGWIVDLRGNGGGNMWPMIAGVGPVVGDGVLGFFISPTGAATMWEFRDGASWSGGSVQQRVTSPYRLRRERPRVAVLTDSAIASSGEATLIAFKERPDTRLFGLPSCGLSTANRAFSLSDGAVLNLTVSVMADRQRTTYGDRVMPDEVLTDRSELIARAVAWLQGG